LRAVLGRNANQLNPITSAAANRYHH